MTVVDRTPGYDRSAVAVVIAIVGAALIVVLVLESQRPRMSNLEMALAGVSDGGRAAYEFAYNCENMSNPFHMYWFSDLCSKAVPMYGKAARARQLAQHEANKAAFLQRYKAAREDDRERAERAKRTEIVIRKAKANAERLVRACTNVWSFEECK